MNRYIIIILFISVTLIAQYDNEWEDELKYHPVYINNQVHMKEAFYQMYCEKPSYDYYLDGFAIEDSIMHGLITSKLSSLLNPDNFSFTIDSVSLKGVYPRVEHSYNKDFRLKDICQNYEMLNDLYIWIDFFKIDCFTATIFTDYSVDIELIEDGVLNIFSQYFPDNECADSLKFISVDIKDYQKRETYEIEPTITKLSRDDIYDDSWAVIIGIDKYKYSDQLNYAVKDAESVKEMLINKFGYPEENIRYLTNNDATLSKIKLALDDIATTAGNNDRIVVFYSGHGETLKGKDGTETGYVLPVEGRQDKPYATGLAMDEILRTCQMSDAKHMLFLMDACYSGLMTENVKGMSKIEEGYLYKVANEKARQIITAGGGKEKVIERDEWQHSAFTKNLLEGLNDWKADTDKNGYITADELGSFLRISVTEDSDYQQTPQKGRFRNSGGGEFIFFSRTKPSAPN